MYLGIFKKLLVTILVFAARNEREFIISQAISLKYKTFLTVLSRNYIDKRF